MFATRYNTAHIIYLAIGQYWITSAMFAVFTRLSFIPGLQLQFNLSRSAFSFKAVAQITLMKYFVPWFSPVNPLSSVIFHVLPSSTYYFLIIFCTRKCHRREESKVYHLPVLPLGCLMDFPGKMFEQQPFRLHILLAICCSKEFHHVSSVVLLFKDLPNLPWLGLHHSHREPADREENGYLKTKLRTQLPAPGVIGMPSSHNHSGAHSLKFSPN